MNDFERRKTHAARRAMEKAKTGLYKNHSAVMVALKPDFPDIDQLLGTPDIQKQINESCAFHAPGS